MKALLSTVLLLSLLSLGLPAAAVGSEDDDGWDDDGECRLGERSGSDECDDDDAVGRWCGELDGAAFGLCNAFCNAQECHRSWKHSCAQLRRNFERKTGVGVFPCEDVDGTATPTATPTRTPVPDEGRCECDCDGDGRVSINDLTRGVLIVLGSVPANECRVGADRRPLTIGDLIRGVRNAMHGC